MKALLLMTALLTTGAFAAEPPKTAPAGPDRGVTKAVGDESQNSDQRSAPTSQPDDREAVEKLVAQLGAREFQQREQAQHELAAIGEQALHHLLPYVTSEDQEIASRVASILGTPRDPELRVKLAMRLIESTDPDWMERGVHMLFKSPGEVFEPFMERTKSARGIGRVLYAPVREQFEAWKRMDDMIQRTYERVRMKDAERAEQLLKTHAESNMYCAEAAYWGALEALEDYSQHPLDDDAERQDPRTPERAHSPGTKNPPRNEE